MMQGKARLMVFAMIIMLWIEPALTEAAEEKDVLVLYTTTDGEVNADVRLLDMALGAFADTITFKNAADVEAGDTEGKSHIFYYGVTKETLPGRTAEVIDTFNGPVTAIGYNTAGLGEGFDFVGPAICGTVTALSMPGKPDKTRQIEPHELDGITIEEGTRVIVEGLGAETEQPVIVENQGHYHVAVNSLVPPFSTYFSQVLYEIFDEEAPDDTPAFIRLEDIHPMADPEQLMDVAELLKERNIPYMMAVIPVYTHPETGEELHFSDSPKVLQAIRYMQDNGGSVVLHGYTHQFRDSETGEGFEFWDVEHDMPIYHGQEETPDMRTEADFDSPEDYEAWQEENLAFEREYIEKRLTRGIQELANYGLYPLAFEAPHYTMSQNGYNVVSDYFSTYVGQVQLHDKDWRTMETTPLASNPTFFHGMNLLPETLSYVHPDDEQAVQKMMDRAHQYQVTDGGMAGGFYHPYLGVERLEKLLGEMEQIPNVEWMDLKEMENTTSAENVVISSGDGTIDTTIDRTGLMTASLDYPAYHAKVLVQKSMWGIAGVGMSAVLLFGVYAVRQRKKEEDIHHG
ncbi:polysaccharide deacetylase family protein [Salibacterium qingdaonense]|nr:polysaccharide deacetylase family protein [Salibacterium qingdaonense]